MNIRWSAIHSFLGLCLLLPVSAQSAEFSIVVIPDTQMYAEQHPEVFEAQMDWIVANQVAETIIYVAHLGDIKDDGLCDTKTVNVGTGGGRSEWQIVDQAIAKLDAANIPYGLAVGNHDFDQPGSNRCPNWTTERPLGTYNSLFGPNRYIGDAHYGDPNATPPTPGNRVVNSNEDNFALFESGGAKFIAINLAYKEAANQSGIDPELDWADDLLKTYDDRIGIVNSHFFVWENPERSNTDPNDEENELSSYGQEVYDRLSNNQNLFLMMSAHRWGEAWRVENTGRDVSWPPTQILLADYQRYFFPFGDGDPSTPFTDPNPALLDFGNLDGSGSFGDSGLMRIIRFDTDTGMANVETFIPPVVPIKGRPSTIVSTYFPASGDEMDKDTASNFGFSFLGYAPILDVPEGGDPVTITFESSPTGVNDFITFDVAGITTYTESGINFTTNDTTQAFFIGGGYNVSGSRLLNPTGKHLFYQSVSFLYSITTASGDGFSLTSFDSAAMYGSTTGADITVTGTFVGGGTITRNISLPHLDAIGNAFQTYTFDNAWSNLANVDVTRTDGDFVGFDNINLVPNAP